MTTRRNDALSPAKQAFPKEPASHTLSTVDILFQKAFEHHRAGQLLQAEALYRQIIQVSPCHSDALHLLGVIACQVEKYEMALELIDKAIQINPREASYYSNRGNALNALQQYQNAVDNFDKAIHLNPKSVEAHNNRGHALLGLEQYEAALKSCNKAIHLKPDFAKAHFNRGNALLGLHQYRAAVESFDKAILFQLDNAEVYNNRGIALNELQKHQAALESFDKAILRKPDFAEGYINRGNALHGLQQYQAALESFDRAIFLKPDFAKAYFNRGNALNELHLYHAALESFDKAILLKLDFAEVYFNRGNALNELQQYQSALESFDKAILLKPDFAEGYNNRGNALIGLQQYQSALESCDKAILLKPEFAEGYINRGHAFMSLRQYQAALESFNRAAYLRPDYEYLRGTQIYMKRLLCEWEDIDNKCQNLEVHIDRNEKVVTPFIFLTICGSSALQKKAAEIYVSSKNTQSFTAMAIPRRPKHDRIRIGYFSADFYNHATSYLMAELFERHDRSRFEIMGFSFGPDVRDEMNERVSMAMDRFMDVRSLSNRGVAQLSRELDVDIAVDLKGFTKDNRGGIFAERAAPIQVNYLGYPSTTGADYMDYLIADHTLIPEASQRHYSEKIVYLPDSYQVNDSKRLISAKPCSRAEEGLPERGFVFCCFNNNYKIGPNIFDIWMRILGRVEGSVLWLLESNPWAGDNLRKEATRRGISQERLIFAKRQPIAEHLARHRLADLFLDTLPCNAHTTASDALWAGLPVLTCMGETFASRVAASLLRAVDLPELVTTTEADYEALAIAIATVPGRAQEIREKLRRNLLITPLFDLSAFTNHLEAAYSAMYERYQADLPPEHIHIARLCEDSNVRNSAEESLRLEPRRLS